MGDLFYFIVIIAVCAAIYIHVKLQGKYREQDRLAREAYEREQQEKTRLMKMEQQERERREFNEKYQVLTIPNCRSQLPQRYKPIYRRARSPTGGRTRQ